MPLDAAERAALFGTESISHQIQRFLMKREGCRVPARELRMAFSDLSKATFASAVISLESKRIIMIEGTDVILDPARVSIPCFIRDRCWKAMRMERRFTAETISVLALCTPRQAKEAIRDLVNRGAVRVVYRKPGEQSIYEIASDAVIRPAGKRKRPGSSKVKAAWKRMRELGTFTVLDIDGFNGISRRYARDLIQLLRKCGCISPVGVMKDGHTKIYKVEADAPPEPPTVD